jgi:hypothetical protein
LNAKFNMLSISSAVTAPCCWLFMLVTSAYCCRQSLLNGFCVGWFCLSVKRPSKNQLLLPAGVGRRSSNQLPCRQELPTVNTSNIQQDLTSLTVPILYGPYCSCSAQTVWVQEPPDGPALCDIRLHARISVKRRRQTICGDEVQGKFGMD